MRQITSVLVIVSATAALLPGCGRERPPSDHACFTLPESRVCPTAGAPVCHHPTGAPSRWWREREERKATGLRSYANAEGRAEGPNAVDPVPTAIAIGPDWASFVSHRGLSVGIGEVLRIAP